MITNYNWQLAKSKVKKLESEIEEWKRTYKNIEKHNPTAENSLAKVSFFALSAMLNVGNLCAHLAYRLPNKRPQ